MVSNKVVSKEELERQWEVAKMMKLKILEVAEEMGVQQGLEQGLQQGVQQGLEQGEYEALAVIRLHTQGKTPEQIAIIRKIPLKRVMGIIRKWNRVDA